MRECAFRVRLRAPLAISSGRPTLFADAGIVRAPDGRPVIPATTIKGAARDAAVGLHRFPRADIDAAFGAPGTCSGSIVFSDGEAAPDAVTVEDVTTVALSDRRTARPGRLVTVERVLPLNQCTLAPLVFSGAVAIAPDRPAGSKTERALAVAVCGLASLRSLGARTRRGWGRIEVGLDPAAVHAVREILADVLAGQSAP